jgi:hypothetical protein
LLKTTIGQFLFFFQLIVTLFAQTESSQDVNNAKINVKHEILMQNNEPGFKITIEGWERFGKLEIYLIDSEGRLFQLISEKDNVTADGKGNFISEVPYLIHKCMPGLCGIIISGSNGIHTIETIMPRVIPPCPKNPKW